MRSASFFLKHGNTEKQNQAENITGTKTSG